MSWAHMKKNRAAGQAEKICIYAYSFVVQKMAVEKKIKIQVWVTIMSICFFVFCFFLS